MVAYYVRKEIPCSNCGSNYANGRWYTFSEFVSTFERDRASELQSMHDLIKLSEEIEAKFASQTNIEYEINGTLYIATKTP